MSHRGDGLNDIFENNVTVKKEFIAQKGGTIQNAPVNAKDIVNKEYVDTNFITDLTSFDTDDLAEGSTNLYDKTITLTQGGATTITGTYPNFTISSTDTNTTYTSSDFDHNSLTNTHNLTTDIDHNSITNTHNLTTDIDHDQLTNFVANEHIDWTQDQGATNIHSGNYTDTNTTYTAGTGLNLAGTEFSCTITQYTDALAVSAVATADDYLKNDANDSTTGILTALSFVASGSSGTSANWDTAYTHSQDNTQAHSDYLLNSGADSAVGPLTITADNSTADQAYVPMVLYNTDATPPTASNFPIGTIYVQYTP